MNIQSRRSFIQIVGSGMLSSSILSSSGLCSAQEIQPPDLLAGFTWIEHAAFRIEIYDKVIYFDPYKITASPSDADFIFITHEHGDHCSLSDIRKIIKDESKIIQDIFKFLDNIQGSTFSLLISDIALEPRTLKYSKNLLY